MIELSYYLSFLLFQIDKMYQDIGKLTYSLGERCFFAWNSDESFRAVLPQK